MPIQLGGPSLPKKKPIAPGAITGYNPQAYVPGGSSPAVATAIQSQGLRGVPKVTIPTAASIVGRQQFATPARQAADVGAGPGGSDALAAGLGLKGLNEYMNEITSDPNYAIGRQNYENALSMGERSLLGDPINQLVAKYGYDPRSYLAANPGAQLPQAALDLANRYLDPTALAAAQRDPTTTANQIATSFGQALSSIPGELAARGRGRGGATAILASQLNQERAVQDRKAMDEFLGGVGTANQNWADYQTQQANIWRGAQEDIATRLAQVAGYHAMLDAQGRAQADTTAEDTQAEVAALQDYSGGPTSIYQPSAPTARLIQRMRSSGEMSSWEKAMQGLTSTTKPRKGVIVPTRMWI